MKTTLYLDTSIPSAYFDTSKPVRQLITQKWFEHETAGYILVTSVVAAEEIGMIKNKEKRENIENLLSNYDVRFLEITEEALALSKKYLSKGAIPASEEEDALHIAIATVNKVEALVSWNFKHIVSINPVRKIHEINRQFGYNELVIGTPEVFGGYKYGNV
jgi:predicted nucleic acid-binding protein